MGGLVVYEIDQAVPELKYALSGCIRRPCSPKKLFVSYQRRAASSAAGAVSGLQSSTPACLHVSQNHAPSGMTLNGGTMQKVWQAPSVQLSQSNNLSW